MAEFETLYRLGLALFIGLLIGTERGWHTRAEKSGERAAGIRTFALIGLLGGLSGLLSDILSDLVLVAVFIGLAALSVAAYVVGARAKDGARGFTTEVAELVTFALGAYAVLGDMALAAIAAVVTVVLLQAKPELHGLVERIDRLELNSAIRLLVISVIVLPLLPNRGFGPGDVINPLELWWMVVLISAVSFAGYFSVKLIGPRAGPLVSGALGGLASSTAVALGFSRLAAKEPGLGAAMATGISIAGAIMFVRVPVIAAFADPELALALAPPLGAMAAATLAATFLVARGAQPRQAETPAEIRDPSDVATALKFGVFLLVLTLVSYFLRERFGDKGLYAVALAAGLADVDAITLTVARTAGDLGSRATAVYAILLAVFSNTLVKAAIPAVIAGAALAWRVAAALGAGLVAGLATLVLM
jgi:uncharacterized membrane protein (DUF4010 family)